MQHFEIKGQVRQAEGKATLKAYRQNGIVPCNLYGLGMENVLFTVVDKELQGLICSPKSFIVDIVLDNGAKYEAILHELQFHPVKDNCLHVDFLAVDDKKPIAISVPVAISGHAKGVQQGGKFYQSCRSLKVSALMANLPDELPVDITPLGLDKQFKASDIAIEGVTVISPKDTIICGVKSTRNTAAVAAAEE